MRKFVVVLSLFLLWMGSPGWGSVKDEGALKKEFEKRFQACLKAFERPEVRGIEYDSVLPPGRIRYREVPEIVSMYEDLRFIPLLIEKLKEGGEVAYYNNVVILLWSITGNDMYEYKEWKAWWEGGEEGVRKKFEENLEKMLKSRDRSGLREPCINIRHMGISVLPMIMEEIRKGNYLLLGVVWGIRSELALDFESYVNDFRKEYDFDDRIGDAMDKYGDIEKVKEEIRDEYREEAEAILKWWDANKKKYLIPWPKKEPKVQKPKKPGVRKPIRKGE